MNDIFLVLVGGIVGIIGGIIPNIVSFYQEKNKTIRELYMSASNTLFLIKMYKNEQNEADKFIIKEKIIETTSKMVLFVRNPVAIPYSNLTKDLYEHLGDVSYYMSKEEEINSLLHLMRNEVL